jgi:peptidoglycan/LPS O-acetylase OafA/YrhL
MPFNGTSLAHNVPFTPAVWASNVSLLFLYFDHPGMLVVAWTLCCEASFYAAAAAMLATGNRPGAMHRALILGLMLCAAAAMAPAAGWATALRLWPDFFAGACVSMMIHDAADGRPLARRAGLWALSALCIAALSGVGGLTMEGRKWAFSFAWLLLVLHRWDERISSSRIARLLAVAGTFSYSLYLLHVPILSRLMNLNRRHFAPSEPAFAAGWSLSVVLAVAGGWLLWRAVERPLEQRRARHRSRRRTARTETAALAVAARR